MIIRTSQMHRMALTLIAEVLSFVPQIPARNSLDRLICRHTLLDISDSGGFELGRDHMLDHEFYDNTKYSPACFFSRLLNNVGI